MKVNSQAQIKIMHSARGVQVIEKTWSALGWEWFGPKNPILPKLLHDLAEKGEAQIEDASGVCYFTTTDKMYIEE